MEIWRKIPGLEDYEASSFGRVKSLSRRIPTALGSRIKKEHIMILKLHPTGYYYVNLRLNKKPLTKKVHRLVALTFCQNPENKPEVNHIDGNKQNNHASNLEWTTPKENCRHKLQMMLRAKKIKKMSMSK